MNSMDENSVVNILTICLSIMIFLLMILIIVYIILKVKQRTDVKQSQSNNNNNVARKDNNKIKKIYITKSKKLFKSSLLKKTKNTKDK